MYNFIIRRSSQGSLRSPWADTFRAYSPNWNMFKLLGNTPHDSQLLTPNS